MAHIWNRNPRTRWRAQIREILFSCDPNIHQVHRGISIFPISKTFCVAAATYAARQQSLISNALFLTFATMRHYQKGLDFPGVTFRPWVRYTVSTLRGASGDQYLFFFYGNVKKTHSGHQLKRTQALFLFFIFYTFRTWQGFWDTGLASSVTIKAAFIEFFPHTGRKFHLIRLQLKC